MDMKSWFIDSYESTRFHTWALTSETSDIEWMSDDSIQYYLNQCRVDDCKFLFEQDRIKEADAVLFNLVDYNPKRVPAVRDPKQLYIAFTLESPGVVVRQNRLLNTANFFNLTMSYRRDSDIVVPYGRTVRRREPQKEQDYWSAKNSSKFIVWFVSDCSTKSKREHYVRELRK
ncbi:3-galactosyl-N-acetylglucosaminide 4-alpha-L-fucosyltransferase FUT3-like [Oratosquilla oratoria]|uniref:3-galactosyl-N-acetylglucosaminide 4-alpha-L-fucosyltransferase FUT3-like n=1 Tax=Oratosquilla oratoria TaxID=337810 RepID=UPI003F76820A